ncbi:hypothetical protein CBS101457_001265 [Exobasidium rhododendri]|nr:hypothetical protein CBS101457_001265 [Exobasidium rhododendri]
MSGREQEGLPPVATSDPTAALPKNVDVDDETQDAMAEPELLALIIELRLRVGRTPTKEQNLANGTNNNSSKTTAATSSAVDTLDLCHRKIQHLPYEMVDIIKDDVIRLALGYNSITALPSSFTDLSRLRYLNIRANLMSVFPAVLCTLPSLEILDISRNKIRKLPLDPGRLVDLRVLSISNNRLKKLPPWLHRLKHLRILKLEGNPISWPPPHISVMPPLDKAGVVDQSGTQRTITDETNKDAVEFAKKKLEDRHMGLWINNLQTWISVNREPAKSNQMDAKAKEVAQESADGSVAERPNLDHVTVSSPTLEDTTEAAISDAKKSTTVDKAEKAAMQPPETPGETKRSIGAAFMSIQSEAASDDEGEKMDEVIALPVDLPSEIHLQSAQNASHSPKGPSSTMAEKPSAIDVGAQDLTTPPLPKPNLLMQMRKGRETGKSLDMSTSMALQRATLQDTGQLGASSSMTSIQGEGSTDPFPANTPTSASLVGAGMATSLRRGLRNKKSLPDLRQNHSALMTEKRETTDASSLPVEEGAFATQRQRRPSGNASSRRPPLPISSSESLGSLAHSSLSSNRAINGEMLEDSKKRHSAVMRSVDAVPPSISTDDSVALDTPDQAHLATDEKAALAGAGVVIEVERNNYFRRLSTLPVSSISQSIPVPVLQCVDATRGILYALSQMHTALKQYITFAADERMTSQLSRALDLASSSLTSFINSLDRFDSLSRTKAGALNPTIVREVLSSSSESVVSFRKVISVLQLQLKSLQGVADVRYTRTLLLLLYGTLAEVGNSWRVMEPLFVHVNPYLQGQDNNITPTIASAGHVNPYTLPSIAEASSPISPDNPRFNHTAGGNSSSARPTRRRHAGSFSAQDVAQGAYMVPTEPLPTLVNNEESRKGQRPAALGPIPTSARAALYQIQQGDIGGGDLSIANDSAVGGAMATSSLADPQTPRDRLQSASNGLDTPLTSNRTMSDTSAGNKEAFSRSEAATPTATSLSSAFALEVSGKTAVDDHLILLLVRITSIAYVVWSSINDHLTMLKIPLTEKEIVNGSAKSKAYTTPENTPAVDGGAFEDSPRTPARNGRVTETSSSSSITIQQNQSEDLMSPASSVGGGKSNALLQQQSLTSSALSRLQQLRQLTNQLVEQTHQLESCCEKVQERSGPRSPPPSSAVLASSHEAFAQLYSESSAFIKSILHISHFLKSLSIEHKLPRSIKSNLGQLTTCARDLTLHLHFLGGPPLLSASFLSSSAAASSSSFNNYLQSPPPQTSNGEE